MGGIRPSRVCSTSADAPSPTENRRKTYFGNGIEGDRAGEVISYIENTLCHLHILYEDILPYFALLCNIQAHCLHFVYTFCRKISLYMPFYTQIHLLRKLLTKIFHNFFLFS